MYQPENPFVPGKSYRVKRTIAYLNHTFHENEIVIFSTSAYDPHNGVTRYWFKKNGSKEDNVWHVFDGAPTAMEIWRNYFEESPN